ncbi:MAG TPA: hypothetical protein VMJ14_06680 [Burkholderiales bacterium]|nr:hypothetical protein [Burkholderiales bacterium]
MFDRRRFFLATLAMAAQGKTLAARVTPDDATTDLDQLGAFERVLGRPGFVIGVPHGTPDAGTLQAGRILCARLGFGGAFVTGFWNGKTRHRINVNRDSEQLIGEHSEVLREWKSPRAAAATERYVALVKEAAQGQLQVFYEIHSNHRPQYTDSIQVSTRGISRGEAERLKEAFTAALERLDADVPRLVMHISPLDRVTFPNYAHASAVSAISVKGCAIEHPGHVFDRPPWRAAYAAVLADAISEAKWS